jgi:hypothetical protein
MGGDLRIAVVIALLSLVAIVGCGGDSSTDAGSDSTLAEQRIYPNVTGPTREFLVDGGDNIVQLAGTEGTEAERREVARLIALWMRARAAEAWKADCKYLARSFRRTLVVDAHGVSNGEADNCPEALEYFGEAASGDGVNNFSGTVPSLRVQGDTAWAQYHGRDGKDWIVPVARESGEWMIAIASPLDRNK